MKQIIVLFLVASHQVISLLRSPIILMSKASDSQRYSKKNLPSKLCVACGRPMTWRKSWEKNWDDVKYCSDKCRKNRIRGPGLNVPNIDPTSPSIISAPINLPMSKLIHEIVSRFPILSNLEFLYKTLRKAALFALVGTFLPFLEANAQEYLHPTKDEVQHVFDDEDWSDISPSGSFPKSDFRRFDESPDSKFYTEPRFVEHIDESAIKSLLQFHTNELSTIRNKVQKQPQSTLDILDLASSWVSHLPSDIYTGNKDDGRTSSRVAGLGMNADELKANKQLTEWIVQDLNVNPVLPYGDKSFDVVLCQLSVDYLTRPVEVLKEAGRVLRPGGELLVSNRVFMDKAVAGWTGKSDIEHIERVGAYIHSTHAFDDNTIQAIDLSKSMTTDPLYVVKATVVKPY